MNKKNNHNVAIAVLAFVVLALLGVIVNLKKANDLHEYAVANKCEWVYQGTAYGDDRDYICK